MEKTPRPSLSDKMVRKTKRGIFHEGKQRTKPRASGEEKKMDDKIHGQMRVLKERRRSYVP